MDGNGRWAQKQGRERSYGHISGAESVQACVEASMEAGIKYLSLYAFSEENWNRPEEEVNGIMKLFNDFLTGKKQELRDNNICFRTLGERSRLSQELQHNIADVEAYTAGCDALTLIVLFSYSGKWDIVQAVNRCLQEQAANPDGLSRLDIPGFEKYLATAGIPDPDLLIRTGGELRISNYLLWQCAYSEFYFTDTLWPDFRKAEFQKALDSFENRHRRYGEIN